MRNRWGSQGNAELVMNIIGRKVSFERFAAAICKVKSLSYVFAFQIDEFSVKIKSIFFSAKSQLCIAFFHSYK